MNGRNMEKVTTVEERFWTPSTYRLCLHKGKRKTCIILITSLLLMCAHEGIFLHLAQPAAQPDTIFLFLNPFFSIKLSSWASDVCEPETVARSMPPAAQKYTRPTCQHPCTVAWWLRNMCQPSHLLLAGSAEPLLFSVTPHLWQLPVPQLPPPPLPYFDDFFYDFGKTLLQWFPCNVSCNQMDGLTIMRRML